MDAIISEKMMMRRRKGATELSALTEYGDEQGLAAVVEKQKKLAEAQKATELPPVVETEKPIVVAKPVAKPKPVEQMPKDELDALRIEEQKRFEARRAAKKGKK